MVEIIDFCSKLRSLRSSKDDPTNLVITRLEKQTRLFLEVNGVPDIRALEIADKAMVEQLYTFCTVRSGNRFWMENDTFDEVERFSEANAGMKQAFEWLSRRGLAVLCTDQDGWDFIELTPKGISLGEDCLSIR